MKKHYLLLATAAMIMAGCANDDFIGDGSTSQSENQAIGFNMSMPAVTRAATQEQGVDAAKTLGYEFIVWGEKNEATKTATDAKNLVFKNYRVQYQSTASTTTGGATSSPTNTNGWEYVGIAPYASTKVSPAIDETKQTIKYWDFKATNYAFTAVSALKDDIDNNLVKITKTEGGSNVESKDKGYTIELTNGAKAENIFVSDRYVISSPYTSGTQVQPVKMAFRNFQTKIRFGFYETVPGYDVKITGVKYNKATQATSSKFGVDGNFIVNPSSTNDKITYTVVYESADNGAKPVLTTTLTGNTSKGYEEFGSNIFTDTKLGTVSSSPLYDIDGGGYTIILPNTGNKTDMTFKVSYKLISEDTGEEILIEDRPVTVPASYCTWKPNFAYTYLFKVSDASADLYPITFDAVVEADQVSKQETITEVATSDTKNVSITTIGFSGTSIVESTSSATSEYAGGNTIYASVADGGTSVTSLDADKMKLYTVTAVNTSNTAVPDAITEAAVANCIKNGGSGPYTLTDLNGVKMTVTAKTDGVTYPNVVPSEDGSANRTVGAMSWSATAGTYYAIEYIKNTTEKYYKIVKIQ